MNVQIDEIESNVDVLHDGSLLTPKTLQSIVQAVMEAMKTAKAQEKSLKSEVGTKSVVEQQEEASGG